MEKMNAAAHPQLETSIAKQILNDSVKFESDSVSQRFRTLIDKYYKR